MTATTATLSVPSTSTDVGFWSAIQPGALGSLDRYIQAVNRLPLLSSAEESDLARRYRLHDDLNAARGLVMSHLRLVVAISRQYLGYGLPQADLIQEGNIGLMKAVKRFDPEHGARLVSFAMQWIKAEMHEYIVRNWRLVKLATTKAQRKLFFNLRSLKASDHTLTPAQTQEIADSLNVKVADVTEMETRLSGRDLALEAPADDERTFAPLDYLRDDRAEPSQVIEDRRRDHLHGEALEQALLTLDDRSRDIVRSRWLSDDKTQTLELLAQRYGVSAERIRQIEQRAFKQLKSALHSAAN